MAKVLFVDTVHPILKERLVELGYSIEEDYTSPKAQVEEQIEDYEGLVIRSRFSLDKKFLDKASNLKFIARSGAGLENIDLAHAEKAGIKVFNSPEGNRDAVGEHAIGMLLMLFHQLRKGDQEVRKGIWDREGNRGIELSGKTVGIVGYGNMGSAFAQKLSGFDCRIIAHDKYKTGFSNSRIEEVGLNELLNESDIISVHLPLSEETHHFVNESFIEQASKPFFLINTARGNNVSISALINGLESGKIKGACLDVLEFESTSFEKINTEGLPKEFVYLIQSNKVILSPHVAGWTVESYEKLSVYLAKKIEQAFH